MIMMLYMQGKSNTYTFMHDGRRHMLKPMAEKEIKIELQITKEVHKIDTKPGTVSLQGREDDMTMVTHGNSMKEMSGNLITRSNYGIENYNIPCQSRPSVMQHNIHRGTDGKLRVLCGPKIRDE